MVKTLRVFTANNRVSRKRASHGRGLARAVHRGAGLIAGLLLGAASAPAADLPSGSNEGAAIYKKHCAVCHGDRGDGNTRVRRGLSPPPRNFTTAHAREELSRERMITSVTYGRPGTAMVAFGGRLSAGQVENVVDYIRATFMTGKAGPARPRRLVLGEEIYTRHCAVCHGDKGSGAMWTQASLNPPPRNFTAPETAAELTRERMITSVTYGRPGTAMMSFAKRLSAAEIEAVVDYVRERFIASAPPPSHPPVAQADMAAPFPAGLHGDRDAGREFYMNNCLDCHGREGNGKGPRSKFINPKPRNFLSADARRRLNRPALFGAVRDGLRGTVMPAWGKVLSDQQIADVAEFVFTAFVSPDASSPAKKKPH